MKTVYAVGITLLIAVSSCTCYKKAANNNMDKKVREFPIQIRTLKLS